MEQKDKELLLKDLGSRLFYDPWVQFNLEYGDNGHKEGLYKAHISSIDLTSGWLEVDYFETETLEKEWSSTIENVKPYLRSMSSMTEEEKREYQAFFNYDGVEYPEEYIDWLNKKMFDYRKDDKGKTMIEKGLALEAPEGMYNIKEK